MSLFSKPQGLEHSVSTHVIASLESRLRAIIPDQSLKRRMYLINKALSLL
jgi:hypothetical protein